MPGKWVPPHLRGKKSSTTFKQTGVRFPSNTTGNNTRNVTYKNAPTSYNSSSNENKPQTPPSVKYKKISKRLATRKLRTKPLKSALKKGKTARYRHSI